MSTIVTRASKGSALTWTEGDANITNLNTDKIENLVDDISPQLGGNLDVNGKSIISTSNGNISIVPNGTGDIQLTPASGKVTISANNFPTSDGPANYVLKTDGNGNLGWVAQVTVPSIAAQAATVTTNDMSSTNSATALALYPYASSGNNSVRTQNSLTYNPATRTLNFSGGSAYINGIYTYYGGNANLNNSTYGTTGNPVVSGFHGGFVKRGTAYSADISLAAAYFSTTGGAGAFGFVNDATVYTNNSSANLATIAAVYTNVLDTPTFASNLGSGVGLTYTDVANLYVAAPAQGTRVTITNNYAILSNGRIKASDFTGTIGATTASTGKFTSLEFKNPIEPIFDLGTTGGTITPDCANGSVQKITLNSALTLNAFTNPTAGETLTLIIYGGLAYTSITSTMKFAGGIKTLTGTTGCIDILSIYFDGTTYFASLGKGYA